MKTTNDVTSVRNLRREGGSALLVSVMVLVLMGLVGLAALDTATRDRQTAGLQTRARAAFYAADAGFATGLNLVRSSDERSDKPNIATTQIGEAAVYAVYGGRPSYRGDPDAADPVVYVMDGGCAAGMSLQVPCQFVETLWRIRVQGDTPGGNSARIDASAKKVLDAGY